MIADEYLTRDLMHTLLKMQTTFRQAIQRNLKQERIDLTFEMLQILTRLWLQDGINQQELAEATFKDKSTLTSLINNLETKQLVIRTADPIDRRHRNIHLTEQGIALGERVKPVIDNIYLKAGLKLNKSETEECRDYLQDLNDVFTEL